MSLNTAQIIGRAKEVWGRDISDQEAGNIMNSTKGGDSGAVDTFLKNDRDYLTKQAIQLQKEAAAPAIASYEATKPEIAAKYATERSRLTAEKPALTDRYQSLLDQIKGKETTATNRQTLTTNNELAKRGISNDSGVYQQEMTNALNPITSEYAGLTKDTTLAREDALRGIDDTINSLTTSETGDMRALQDAIAQLMYGSASTGISQGISNYQFGAQQALEQQKLDEQKRQSDIQNALAQLQAKGSGSNPYQLISEGQSLINPLTGQLIYSQPKTYRSTAAGVGGSTYNPGGV